MNRSELSLRGFNFRLPRTRKEHAGSTELGPRATDVVIYLFIWLIS